MNVVLELGDLVLELVERDELVLDDDGHLELLDTVTDRDELRETPNESGLLDRTDRLFEFGHVRLVVPRLDVESDERLGNGPGDRGGASGTMVR